MPGQVGDPGRNGGHRDIPPVARPQSPMKSNSRWLVVSSGDGRTGARTKMRASCPTCAASSMMTSNPLGRVPPRSVHSAVLLFAHITALKSAPV